MIETWRWFGPSDPISLKNVAQAGARGVVTALYEVPTGEVWQHRDIMDRKHQIETAGLEWNVIESIPVHDDIKRRSGDYKKYVENYQQSLKNAGAAGVRTVCYNFMPVIDWTRTNLLKELPNSAKALSFDMAEMATYDLFILERDGSQHAYDNDVIERAEIFFRTMSETDKQQLEQNILAGLPGGQGSYDRESFRIALARYEVIGESGMRANLVSFLQAVIPVAEKAGVKMCIHPDDPPFSLFGLPRVMSTADDVRVMLEAVPSSCNGLTLCAGSFGARGDNDLIRMVEEFGSRIFFVHLRNVRREKDGSFYESDHLEGDNDMLGLISAFLDEEDQRQSMGNGLGEIPMRPDHGHLIGNEAGDGHVAPGYSYSGRVKGLAELRGVIFTLKRMR